MEPPDRRRSRRCRKRPRRDGAAVRAACPQPEPGRLPAPARHALRPPIQARAAHRASRSRSPTARPPSISGAGTRSRATGRDGAARATRSASSRSRRRGSTPCRPRRPAPRLRVRRNRRGTAMRPDDRVSRRRSVPAAPAQSASRAGRPRSAGAADRRAVERPRGRIAPDGAGARPSRPGSALRNRRATRP